MDDLSATERARDIAQASALGFQNRLIEAERLLEAWDQWWESDSDCDIPTAYAIAVATRAFLAQEPLDNAERVVDSA